MPISDKITKAFIEKAIVYIDTNGVPKHRKSTSYDLIVSGKKYPPKYALAVAAELAHSEEVFTSIDARKFLEKLGYKIEYRGFPSYQEIYELTFLSLKALGHPAKKQEIYDKNRELGDFSDTIKNKWYPQKRKYKLDYVCDWALTDLKKFGAVDSDNKGTWKITDAYSDIDEINGEDVSKAVRTQKTSSDSKDESIVENENINEYTNNLLISKNIIFRGAPGTGKSYLAKEIAADIISDGEFSEFKDLEDDQKKQIEFVQFHPSYDYSDFVEGLRPVKGSDGIEFELQDGIFKKFVENAKANPAKKYVFIIDEINRGEISKILGELFFAIDPGYRGEKGAVSTQYANLHKNPDEKFYVPENVYIIGTMNDIDRSVDSFDFAMRRRFRFIEIKADENVGMLDILPNKNDVIACMQRLNEAILTVEGLNENYQIGAAYFLKLKDIDFEELWSDYLEPLLQDYVTGMYEYETILKDLKKAYDGKPDNNGGTADEADPAIGDEA